MLTALLKTVAATVVVLALLALVAEVACRLVATPDTPGTAAGFVIPDPELLWRLAPQADGPLATNELGLRDAPFNAAAQLRVLVLGDSVAWGDHLPMTFALFPSLMEESLKTALAPRSVEVINAGVPGYSTFQELAYYRRAGRKLAPQVVVLEFCLNDVVERFTTVSQYGGDGVFLGVDTREAVAGLQGYLLRHSRAYETLLRSLQRRARRREAYTVSELVRPERNEMREHAWHDTFASLEELIGEVRRDGARFLLAIFPYRFQLADPAGTRGPQDRLIAFAKAHDVEWIDLLDGFIHMEKRSRIFLDENHLAVGGHELAAKLLAPRVRALLDADRDAAASR